MKNSTKNDLWIYYLQTILNLEHANCLEQALSLFDHMLLEFPEEKEWIFYERGKLRFRNMDDKAALLDFIQAYGLNKNEEIYNLILEAYYAPNIEEFNQTYDTNINLLKDHACYRTDFLGEKICNVPIWYDETLLVLLDMDRKEFSLVTHAKKAIQFEQDEDISVLSINMLYMEEILDLEKKSRIKEKLLDMENPMYLAFDRRYWEVFIQLNDISELLMNDRIFFLVGYDAFYQFFLEEGVVKPNVLLISNESEEKYSTLLDSIIRKLDVQCLEYMQELKTYYEEHRSEMVQRIREGKPKFFFVTSRFTTAAQYHTRDCMQAVEKLGCSAKLILEGSRVSRIYPYDWAKYLLETKPDIIFCIDYFRYEYEKRGFFIPKEMLWLTWIQDPLQKFISKESPEKLTENDYILNHFISWNKFFETGYHQDNYLLDAPIPANDKIYRHYDLTDEEKGQYGCDVCFVCHAADNQAYVDKIYAEMYQVTKNKLFSSFIAELYIEYYMFAYKKGNIFYDKEAFEKFLKSGLEEHHIYEIDQELLEYIVQDMYLNYNYVVYHCVLVDWLLDAGYTKIKLWGKEWKQVEKYKPYAMGPAENGVMLSKVYQAAKIVVGNNHVISNTARCWESRLSGAFFMDSYVPKESDLSDIRMIADENTELVMFCGREDFLEKISYYLTHEQERNRMAEVGYQAAVDRMTYDAMMKKVINGLKNRIGKSYFQGIIYGEE